MPCSNGVAQSVPESSFRLTVSRSHSVPISVQRLSQPEPRSRLPVRVDCHEATPCQGRAGGGVWSGGTFIGALAESLDWCGILEKPHGRQILFSFSRHQSAMHCRDEIGVNASWSLLLSWFKQLFYDLFEFLPCLNLGNKLSKASKDAINPAK